MLNYMQDQIRISSTTSLSAMNMARPLLAIAVSPLLLRRQETIRNLCESSCPTLSDFSDPNPWNFSTCCCARAVLRVAFWSSCTLSSEQPKYGEPQGPSCPDRNASGNQWINTALATWNEHESTYNGKRQTFVTQSRMAIDLFPSFTKPPISKGKSPTCDNLGVSADISRVQSSCPAI